VPGLKWIEIQEQLVWTQGDTLKKGIPGQLMSAGWFKQSNVVVVGPSACGKFEDFEAVARLT